MITLNSYVAGRWQAGSGAGRTIRHAVTGEEIAVAGSEGVDFAAMVEHARTVGGPALAALDFQQRASMLRAATKALNEHLEELYEIAATYGAGRKDAWVDIEGGIAAVAVQASLARKGLPAADHLVDGDPIGLSREGSFGGQHLWVPRRGGVAVQINAYNFPSWGMLEKLAPALLAGMPVITKPATPTAWLAVRMVEILIESGTLPEGSLQLVSGSVGDLLDHLESQDVVAFTGSASTGSKIRSHPRLVARNVRINLETDSLNAIVLGPDVEPGSDAFAAFVKEVARELTVKAGQKCTAIRRVLVPSEREGTVLEALRGRLTGLVIGDPAEEGVRMGPLVSRAAVAAAREGIELLRQECEIVFGDPDRTDFVGAATTSGAFMEPIVLRCPEPMTAERVHEVEVFGPAATVLAYDGAEQAIELARRGGGSLVASVWTEDDAFATELAFALAPYHGRLMLMSATAAAESTGHGIVMPQLVHGGPGRAGGGEELGGLRGLYHYLNRVALQGPPERLAKIAATEPDSG